MVKVKRFLKFATGDFFSIQNFSCALFQWLFFCLPVTINFCRVSDKYRETSPVTLGLVMSQNICLDLCFIYKNRVFYLPEFSLVRKNPRFQRQETNLLFFDKLFRAECNPHLIRFPKIFFNRNINKAYRPSAYLEKSL